MSETRPAGGRLLTLPIIVLGALSAVALWILVERFVYGLGAVTNLNNGYPWGLWVVYDIVVGTGFACGGYVVALMCYVANDFRYHALVRPALLASLFGYTLGGISAFFDMGRYLNAPNMFLPWHHNYNSVMLEVGLCVFTYILVLLIEFSPALLSGEKLARHRRRVEKALFFFIALGIVLPTMHQSSLGSLLIALGSKVSPLWQSEELLPLLALASAVIMGFSIVVFEGSFAALGFKRPSETPLLARFTRPIIWVLCGWLALRFGELIVNGKGGATIEPGLRAFMFWVEIALFTAPLWVLMSERRRGSGRLLLLAAVSMLLAAAVYRFNAFLIGYNPSPGWMYFPSVSEIMVSLGLVAFEILAYIVIVKRFPVLHAPLEPAARGAH